MGLETYLFNAQPHHRFEIGPEDSDSQVVVHGGETVDLDPEKDAAVIASGAGQLVKVDRQDEVDVSHRDVLDAAKGKTKTSSSSDGDNDS